MELLDKITRFLNQLLIWIAGIFLLGMVAITCANIFLRVVWIPIKGVFELVGFFGAITTAFALGYTQIKRGHVAVDLLVNRFSARTRSLLNGINYFICMIFFAGAGWQMAVWAATLCRTGELTETLRIIFYPFTYAVAFGCFVLTLVLLVDFLKLLINGKGAK